MGVPTVHGCLSLAGYGGAGLETLGLEHVMVVLVDQVQ